MYACEYIYICVCVCVCACIKVADRSRVTEDFLFLISTTPSCWGGC